MVKLHFYQSKFTAQKSRITKNWSSLLLTFRLCWKTYIASSCADSQPRVFPFCWQGMWGQTFLAPILEALPGRRDQCDCPNQLASVVVVVVAGKTTDSAITFGEMWLNRQNKECEHQFDHALLILCLKAGAYVKNFCKASWTRNILQFKLWRIRGFYFIINL